MLFLGVSLEITRWRSISAHSPSTVGGRHITRKNVSMSLRSALVENNLIIAMNGEDIMRRLGADVATAPSVAEAIEILTGQSFDLALLDVDLGDETSFGIADRLAADGVPFLFATGYGEGIAQASSHSDAPVLQKPYTMEGMTHILARVPLPRRG